MLADAGVSEGLLLGFCLFFCGMGLFGALCRITLPEGFVMLLEFNCLMKKDGCGIDWYFFRFQILVPIEIR